MWASGVMPGNLIGTLAGWRRAAHDDRHTTNFLVCRRSDARRVSRDRAMSY
jgi:hypothetical protein